MTATMTTIAADNLIPLGTPCPSWCVGDHDKDRHPADRSDPLHSGVSFELGADSDNERNRAWVGLMRDTRGTVVYVSDDLQLTLDDAQQLVTVLPGLIAKGRQGQRRLSIDVVKAAGSLGSPSGLHHAAQPFVAEITPWERWAASTRDSGQERLICEAVAEPPN